MNKDTQLCWKCKRATGGCGWSRSGKPIKGWDAEKVTLKDLEGDIRTYKIKKCPLFLPDDIRQGGEINIRELAEIIKIPYEEIRRKKDEALVKIAKERGIRISVIHRTYRKILIEEAE